MLPHKMLYSTALLEENFRVRFLFFGGDEDVAARYKLCDTTRAPNEMNSPRMPQVK